MPLHADDAAVFVRFHCLYCVVGGYRRNLQVLARIVHRLVMERIDVYAHRSVGGQEGVAARRSVGIQMPVCGVCLVEHGAGRDGDRVCRFVLRCALAVLYASLDVLADVSAQCDGDGLHAAADAEHGQMAVVGEAAERQLVAVAQRIDRAELRHRLFAHPQGVVVAAAGEDDGMKSVEQREDRADVGGGREEDGSAAGTFHLKAVHTAQAEVFAAAVAGDAYERTGGSLGIYVVDVSEAVVYVEVGHDSEVVVCYVR